MIRSHTFRGKRWRIVHRKPREPRGAIGTCDAPNTPDKVIMLDPALQGHERTQVAIHEATHALLWELDEEVVEQFARDMALFLRRLGCLKEE